MFISLGNGYMGHLVCFPHYGPASADERAQGLRGHGEAGSVEWQQTRAPEIDAQHITFYYGADLPVTHYKIERAVTLKAGEANVHVEEWIENLAAYDRPYNRNQHATFGAPFVTRARTVLDMSGTRGMTDPTRTAGSKWNESALFQWPDAPRRDGTPLSLRDFHAVPGGQVYTPVLTDRSKPQSWFTMFNQDYPLLVGYVFPTDDHLWINDWQDLPSHDSPAGTARGIEFGTSPFDEGLRKSVERGQMLGAPTYKFIGARQRLSTTFTIFLKEIPAGFPGVRDLRFVDGIGYGGNQVKICGSGFPVPGSSVLVLAFLVPGLAVHPAEPLVLELEPGTLNPEPRTRNLELEPGTWNPEPSCFRQP